MTVPPLVEDEPGALGALRRRAREVAAACMPDAARWDADEVFPEASLDRLRAAGLSGLTVPETYGGSGLGVVEACAVLEELAVACQSTAMALQLYVNGPPRAIAVLGDEAQRERFLPGAVSGERFFAIAISEPQAGSDATAMTTTITPDGRGYRLDGRKHYITGGARADTVLVFCRLAGTSGPKGIGAVVVERGRDGFSVGATPAKMGSRGVGEAELRFDDVRIEPGDVLVRPDAASSAGAALMLRQFNPERCGNAAMVLGTARGALEQALVHLRTREQFGRELGSFQGLQWKVADCATDLDAARLLLARAAASDEDGFPRMRDTAMAKVFANEAAERICHAAIQLHGHAGFTRALDLERRYRDVRGMSLAGGTVEVLRNVLAAEVLGRRYSQR